MEGNRDDAKLCLQLAADALRDGDSARATRLLAKSCRMYPLGAEQEQLSKEIRNSQSHAGSSRSFRSSKATAAGKKIDENENCNPAGKPSREMLKAVESIRKISQKSHYQVLGVPRDSNTAAIKSAYRKLALRLHPDRNFSPGADEAFKRVGQAFMTLSDAKRREYYDRTGVDGPEHASQSHVRRRASRARAHFASESQFETYAQELGPEELMEFLFARASGNRQFFAENNNETLSSRHRMYLIIILGGFILLAMMLTEREAPAIYSLTRTPVHVIPNSTPNHVSYFTPRSVSLTSEAKRKLERKVEINAVQYYRSLCLRELKQEAGLRTESQRWFISSALRARYKMKYENFAKPWCQKTHQLQKVVQWH